MILKLLHLVVLVHVENSVGPAGNALLAARVEVVRAYVVLVSRWESDLALLELGDDLVMHDGLSHVNW